MGEAVSTGQKPSVLPQLPLPSMHTRLFVLLSEFSTISIHENMSDIGWGNDSLR